MPRNTIGPHELVMCQMDAYARSVRAVVLECDRHIFVDGEDKKKRKTKTLFAVRLNDTVLFPEVS